MQPGTVRIFRGDTWRRAWVIQAADGAPVDLSGATARLHVRNAAGALVMSADTTDGRLALTPAEGRADLEMPAAVTAAVTPGRYRFDIEITFAGGRVQTYEQAALVVIEDMSRD